MSHQTPTSVCLLRLSALGDCINAFGLACALKRQHPQLELLWLIDRRFASLFRRPDGSDLIPLLCADFKTSGTAAAALSVRRALRGRRFDCLLDLQTSLKASVCAFFIQAGVKYGYDRQRGREGQGLFVDKKVPSPTNPHVLAGFMAFAAAAGLGELKPYWDFELAESELAACRELLPPGKIFTIAPASAKAAKNWTPKGYAALAAYAQSQGFHTVLAGSADPAELQLCSTVNQLCRGSCLNLCGKTSLRGLAALLKLSNLVLSPDSASMHLASALHTPVIGLFAIHDPRRVGAWNYPELGVSVYARLAAKERGPGRPLPWRYRVRDPNAMQQLDPAAVKAAFDLACRKYLPDSSSQISGNSTAAASEVDVPAVRPQKEGSAAAPRQGASAATDTAPAPADPSADANAPADADANVPAAADAALEESKK